MGKRRFQERLRIIPRERWGARPPRSVTKMNATPRKLYVHHLVASFHRAPNWSERVFFGKACAFIREVQDFHMDGRGWSDTGYSFIILKPFFRRMWVFECRGWNVVGAHTEGSNSSSIGVAAAGNYMNERAGFRLVYTFRRLIEKGLNQNHLAGNRRSLPTGGHQDAPGAATACPGKNLQAKVPDMQKPTRRWRRDH